MLWIVRDVGEISEESSRALLDSDSKSKAPKASTNAQNTAQAPKASVVAKASKASAHTTWADVVRSKPPKRHGMPLVPLIGR